MTKRAEQALRGLYDPAANPAIGKLVEFAAQNPGLEFGNYGQWDIFNQERGRITRDWAKFRVALQKAAIAGVTDQDVIDASRRAFSGRLEWFADECRKQNRHWEYTTGQYFPTEYRRAATAVLEQAIYLRQQSVAA